MSFRNGTLHVTIRLVDGLPHLRTPRTVRWIRRCLKLSEKPGFRVVHYSVQGNHLHLLVEADDPDQLSSGMRGLSARLSRRLNQLFGRRRKPVFDGRYHARLLGSPLEARWALSYVLGNYRKHSAQAGRALPSGWVDPFSSAPRFDGWTKSVWSEDFPGIDGNVISEPQTWLLSVGWRKAGAIDPDVVPGQDSAGVDRGERDGTVSGGCSEKP